VVVPDSPRIHRELDRKGMTLMLLWSEYVAAHSDGRTWRYTQFCKHYKAFARTLKRSMRQHRRAGEKLLIDYAGSTVALRGGARAQVFVAAMGASSRVFACATPAQRLDDWIEAMVRALHFYGGVPQLIVPGNARAVIASPDRYEPRANDTVLDFARHYGCSVLSTRPRSPKDEATAESSVQVITRWVLARRGCRQLPWPR
jgi:transposase